MDDKIYRSRKFFSLSLFLVFAIFSPDTSAVTLLEDNRQVTNLSNSGLVVITPSAPFADFSTSRQDSIVGPSHFSGTGSGSAFFDFMELSIRNSIFDVTFRVSQQSMIELSGNISANGSDGGRVGVQLFDGVDTSSDLLFSEIGSLTKLGAFSIPFDFVGLLPAGDYRLVVFTDLSPDPGGVFGGWSFDAFHTAVPIPAVGWILGALYFGLLVRVRLK